MKQYIPPISLFEIIESLVPQYAQGKGHVDVVSASVTLKRCTYFDTSRGENECNSIELPSQPLCGLVCVKITGRFCQCDHASCPTGADGRQCSGNGVCECGKCRCEDGWERDDCSCSTDKGTCMEGGVECSGNGHCECGKCICDEGFNGALCGAADEVVTASPPKDMSEEEPTEPVEPATTEEDVQDMVDESVEPSSEDAAAPESTDSDYGAEAETPEEAMTSSAVFISFSSFVVATLFF
ncbi:EGF-like domain protein [Oesophagostomum dentatum]|uniref:EGF-like domain protein n=1 Tax=Oesophagostomum dentatum TaxID=61180 RepID=A0A0B1TUT5_OESDE|nr:EGF-like domain protein [Oesophagostomum dentatum]